MEMVFDPQTEKGKSEQILIFRLGSIGDFVVSLPSFHLIRKTYSKASISLLTNQPVSGRAAPAESVLDGTQLVDRYISYPPGTRRFRELIELRKTIKAITPTKLIYLAERKERTSILRDYLFFRSCGIGEIIGIPKTRDLQRPRHPTAPNGLWESEAQRLGRQLISLGNIDFELAENWNLNLSSAEIGEANSIIEGWTRRDKSTPLVSLSVGTKLAIKDWGTENWRAVLKGLADLDFGIVFIGSSEDWERSQTLSEEWAGPSLNLCGKISPRLSAAVIRQTVLLLCHDSGPMHLGAAVGTRCVAVFSRQSPPGQWYPFGSGHKVFYPPGETDTIRSIKPDQVIPAIRDMLGATKYVSSVVRNAKS
jgi:ADP-heptose:LPS heptosyltransferase